MHSYHGSHWDISLNPHCLKLLLISSPCHLTVNLTLQCLTKVAALNTEELYNVQLINMHNMLMPQLQYHNQVLESTETYIDALLMGLKYLIDISYVDDTGVSKICLNYWNSLVLELFEPLHNLYNPAATDNMMGQQSIRETLIYLLHLDHEDTEKQMLKKLYI